MPLIGLKAAHNYLVSVLQIQKSGRDGKYSVFVQSACAKWLASVMFDIPTVTCSSSSGLTGFPFGPRLMPSRPAGDISSCGYKMMKFLWVDFPLKFHVW
jgi:hypothetical protein